MVVVVGRGSNELGEGQSSVLGHKRADLGHGSMRAPITYKVVRAEIANFWRAQH